MRPVARLIIRIVGRRAETVSCGVDPCRQRRLIRDGHGLGNPQVVGGVLVVCVLVSCVAGLLAGVERLEHLAAGARAEFEAGEQFRKRVGVHLAECQILDADTEVDVAPQRVDLAVELDLLDVLAQRLALLAAYLVGVLDDTLKSAVLVDPSPTPGTPGMLSAVSPRNAARSGYCAGLTWYLSSTACGVMCLRSLK